MPRSTVYTFVAFLGGLLLALVFTLGYVLNDGDGDGNTTTIDVDQDLGIVIRDGDIDFDTLEEIIDILASEYVGRENLDERALYEAAINGLLDSLADTGTFYIDSESFQLSIGPSGTFEGIGAQVTERGEDIIITRTFEDSPAEASGVEAGDRILAVDGDLTDGWSVDQAVLRIRGERGTQVTIEVEHLDGIREELTITREEIQVDSVSTTPPGGILNDAAGDDASDIAYLRIIEFTERTPEEVEAVAREAETSGSAGLIIDVRSNPGGLLQETVDTADIFLDGGRILTEVNSDDEEFHHEARPGGAALEIPIVILQDQFSASGAEVLAAALRDNGRATIIGETSFGKGTVNVSQELSDGGALFVTVRHWLTPAGIQIDGVGITPDQEAGPGLFDPAYDPEQDAQIHAAIDHLRSLAASGEPLPSSVTP